MTPRHAKYVEPEYRKVKRDETVTMDCGCEIEITRVVNGIPTAVAMLMWCDKHDPTLAANAPDDER